MKHIQIIALILFLSLPSVQIFAQQLERNYDRTPEDEKRIKLFRNNFFRQRGMTALWGDVVTIPQTFETQTSRNGETITGEDADRFRFMSLFTYTHEFRYNFLNYRDYFSLSVASPLSAGLYLPWTGGDGVFIGVRTPIVVDANFGMHSTFNNIDRLGFYVGGGLQPFINIGNVDVPMQKFFRVGLKYPYRGRLAFLEFSAGNGPEEEFADQKLRTSFYKVTFGRLIKL